MGLLGILHNRRIGLDRIRCTISLNLYYLIIYKTPLDVWDITFAKNQQYADESSARRRHDHFRGYVIIPWCAIFSDDRKVHILIPFIDNCPHAELSKNLILLCMIMHCYELSCRLY